MAARHRIEEVAVPRKIVEDRYLYQMRLPQQRTTLGADRHNRRWTEKEDVYLLEHWDHTREGTIKIALKLGRTFIGCKVRYKTLNTVPKKPKGRS